MLVNPYDIERTADELRPEMNPEERTARMQRLQGGEGANIYRWAEI